MTLEDQTMKFEKIMKENEMKIIIRGCGCCNSPWVKFEHKGELIVFDKEDNGLSGAVENFLIDMFEEKK
jgi:hypothetical protein